MFFQSKVFKLIKKKFPLLYIDSQKKGLAFD